MAEQKDTNYRESPLFGEKITPSPVYTNSERAYLRELIRLLNQSRDDREKPLPEFDGMTYSQNYDTNKRADMAYVAPKVNRVEKRVVMGVTREKDNFVISKIKSYQFEPTITSFNPDNVIMQELGESMEDLTIRSRTIEGWDEKAGDYIREYVAQGDVFIEENWRCVWEDEVVPTTNWQPGDPIKDAGFLRRGKVKYERADTRMVPGVKVFLGNIKCSRLEEQPLIATYEVIHRFEAERLYGTWDRWENVPYQVDSNVVPAQTFSSVYQTFNWSLQQVEPGYVGVLKIQMKHQNRYQIMLNGILMLPMDFPLTFLSPDGEYTIVQGRFEPIVDFAYSKSQPAKMKMTEAVYNEMMRLMILKMEQSFMPPLANRTGRVLPKSIFYPGEITADIDVSKLSPLLTGGAQGITPAEFSFFSLMRQALEDRGISQAMINSNGSAAPNSNPADTATAVIEKKNAEMLDMALALDGWINLEKKLVWKRIQTILWNETKPINQDELNMVDGVEAALKPIYKSIEVDANIGGRRHKRIYEMKTENFPQEADHLKHEAQLSTKHGKEVKKIYLNPEVMRQMKLMWLVSIVPRDKNNDKLAQLMFTQCIKDAVGLFGPESLNLPYLKKRFAAVWEEDFVKFFVAEASNMPQPVQQNQQMQDPNAQQQDQGNQKSPYQPLQQGILSTGGGANAQKQMVSKPLQKQVSAQI